MQMLSTQMYGYLWGEPDEVWEERIRELSPYKSNKESYGECRRESNLPSLPAGIP